MWNLFYLYVFLSALTVIFGSMSIVKIFIPKNDNLKLIYLILTFVFAMGAAICGVVLSALMDIN